MSDWKYDPGERRIKHKWSKDEAGFDPPDVPGSPGKCPSSVTRTPGLAERLLNDGIPWPTGAAHPERIYNVYQGVVYRAVPAIAGKIYHGFPEKEQHGRLVPNEVLDALAERADNAEEFHKFRDWAKKHLKQGWIALTYKPKSA
ncbi:MAG: hypothetical protein HQM03_19915 [Magnetococcales bacterium]|nr:hypothetical protein [Magnetococcales bacterium]